VAVERVPEFEAKLLEYLQAEASAILKSIRESGNLALQTEEELKLQLIKFQETHRDLFNK
jgi:F0F1-type ATP synthase alpha subunit